MLVSLEFTKAFNKEDSSANDDVLTVCVEGASEAIAHYINTNDEFLDSDRQPQSLDSDGVGEDIPADVKIATAMFAGIMSKNRDGNQDKDFQAGYLPDNVTSLLCRYHTPALA